MLYEFLIYMDTDTAGRLYFGNANRVEPFDSMDELFERLHDACDGTVYGYGALPEAPAVKRCALIPIRVSIFAANGGRICGYALWDGNRQTFWDKDGLHEIIRRRIKAARSRQSNRSRQRQLRRGQPPMQISIAACTAE